MKAAKQRWLNPDEILQIIKNRKELGLPVTNKAPQNPSSGSVFLINRKEVRNFRKDGHEWKQKRGKQTAEEFHARLNVSIDDPECKNTAQNSRGKAKKEKLLNCYYAYGKQNKEFQRRSYWMLQEDLSYIVFVHYRDVKETVFNTEVGSSSSDSFHRNGYQLSSQTTHTTNLSRAHEFEHENAELGAPAPEELQHGESNSSRASSISSYGHDELDSFTQLSSPNWEEIFQEIETTENDSPARPNFENQVSQVPYVDTADRCGDIENIDLFNRFVKFVCVHTPIYKTEIVSVVYPYVSDIHAILEEDNDYEDSPLSPTLEKVMEEFVQKCLKEKLSEWFTHIAAEGGKGACVFDENGQSVLHLAAALGYDWAIESTIIAGVDINFRDANGWTALHWAAHCGRKRTVEFLINRDADREARSNGTPDHPSGKTPADLASAIGNEAIVAYLAHPHSISCH